MGTHVYTDEYESYTTIERPHPTVCHAAREWARDGDGDGTREAHTNSCEGMWAARRTYLRVFRGVHKRYLSGYVALHEFRVNLKAVTELFVATLVLQRDFAYTSVQPMAFGRGLRRKVPP